MTGPESSDTPTADAVLRFLTESSVQQAAFRQRVAVLHQQVTLVGNRLEDFLPYLRPSREMEGQNEIYIYPSGIDEARPRLPRGAADATVRHPFSQRGIELVSFRARLSGLGRGFLEFSHDSTTTETDGSLTDIDFEGDLPRIRVRDVLHIDLHTDLQTTDQVKANLYREPRNIRFLSTDYYLDHEGRYIKMSHIPIDVEDHRQDLMAVRSQDPTIQRMHEITESLFSQVGRRRIKVILSELNETDFTLIPQALAELTKDLSVQLPNN